MIMKKCIQKVNEKVLTIEEYLNFINLHPISGINTPVNLTELREFLDSNDSEDIQNLWDYPLNEIEHIVENKLKVTLVKDSNDYRWFQFAN